MASTVLDASALLAYLADEPGADAVSSAIAGGTAISAVDLAEVFSQASNQGSDPADLYRQMAGNGLLEGAISIEEFTAEDAIEVARLRPLTREAGLSLGDRACLALASRLGIPAVTADTAWSRVELDVETRQIR